MRFVGLFFFVFGLMFLVTSTSHAQNGKHYQVAVFFKDKDTMAYVNKPSLLFSERALQRKQLQQISIDARDYPVNTSYVNQLQQHGFFVHSTSKWFNCAVVYLPQQRLIDSLKQFPFVTQVEWIGLGKLPEHKATSTQEKSKEQKSVVTGSVYGKAQTQTAFCHANELHKNKLTGQQTLVAVFDAGFLNAHQHAVLQPALKNVITTVDLLNADNNVFDDDAHGTAVWSCMAANDSFEYIGTSPDANYILIRTEDAKTEYPSEEFFWTIAAEFADSCGVDIIHSSLGYNEFDDVFFNHTHKQLNGNTAWISKAAKLATEKGMFVVNSAGNEGNNDWRLVAFPADVPSVLTVGSVNSKDQLSNFSSIGWQRGNEVKPNIVMLGENVAIANDFGYIHQGDGTSYAAPIITGGLACLWPLLKSWSADSVIKFVQYTSNRFNEPNKYFGYGVPNFGLMYKALQSYKNDTLIDIYKNSVGYIQLSFSSTQKQDVSIEVLDDEFGVIEKNKFEAEVGFQRFSVKEKTKKSKHPTQLRFTTKKYTTLLQIP